MENENEPPLESAPSAADIAVDPEVADDPPGISRPTSSRIAGVSNVPVDGSQPQTQQDTNTISVPTIQEQGVTETTEHNMVNTPSSGPILVDAVIRLPHQVPALETYNNSNNRDNGSSARQKSRRALLWIGIGMAGLLLIGVASATVGIVCGGMDLCGSSTTSIEGEEDRQAVRAPTMPPTSESIPSSVSVDQETYFVNETIAVRFGYGTEVESKAFDWVGLYWANATMLCWPCDEIGQLGDESRWIYTCGDLFDLCRRSTEFFQIGTPGEYQAFLMRTDSENGPFTALAESFVFRVLPLE